MNAPSVSLGALLSSPFPGNSSSEFCASYLSTTPAAGQRALGSPPVPGTCLWELFRGSNLLPHSCLWFSALSQAVGKGMALVQWGWDPWAEGNLWDMLAQPHFLCGFQVFVRLGRQKWRLKGKIETDDSQTWDEEEKIFIPNLHEKFEIKVWCIMVGLEAVG